MLTNSHQNIGQVFWEKNCDGTFMHNELVQNFEFKINTTVTKYLKVTNKLCQFLPKQNLSNQHMWSKHTM